MTIDQFRYFLEAARFEHIGNAARSASISPSAISSAISSLEQEFGIPLFNRQGRQVFLNDQGKILKIQVETLFDHLNGMAVKLKSPNSTLSGNYRLGASHFLASRYLGKAWTLIQKNHPLLSGEIFSSNSAKLIDDVAMGVIDFGLSFSPLVHPDLKQIELHTGQLKIAVRKGHPLLKKGQKNLFKELSRFPATIHKALRGVDLCEAHPVFEKFGIKPKIDFLFDSDDIAIERLSNSDSWALLPDIVITNSAKQIVPLPLPPQWSASYVVSVVIQKHRASNPVFELTIKKLMELFGSHRYLSDNSG